jgi:hypothetical protein
VNWDGQHYQADGISGGKAGDCPRPGRRLRPRPLACGRCRARRPTPGGRPRYRQAGGDPPSRCTRHRASGSRTRTAGCRTRLSRESVASGASPLDPARDYPGGGRNLSRALLRRVPSGRPLTEPRPRVPRTHSARRVEGRSGEALPHLHGAQARASRILAVPRCSAPTNNAHHCSRSGRSVALSLMADVPASSGRSA